VKHHCQCTCAEFLTEDVDSNSANATIDNVDVDVDGKSSPTSLPISSLSTSTSSSSCPNTNKLLSGNSCVNSNNDEKILSCDYNYINITSCDTEIVVNTPEDTCECDAGDNNPIWECYKLDPVPCDVAPAPASAAAQTTPTPTPTPTPTQLPLPILDIHPPQYQSSNWRDRNNPRHDTTRHDTTPFS